MTDIDGLPSWSKSDDTLPPLGESPAMAAARRSAAGGSAFAEPPSVKEPGHRRRLRPPAFLAPALVVLAGFIGGILLASEFITVGDSTTSAEVAAQDQTLELTPVIEQNPAAEESGVDLGSDVGFGSDVDLGSDEVTVGAADPSGPSAGPVDETEAETEVVTGRPLLPEEEYEVRYSQGRLYLSGALPDKSVEEVIVQRASAIVGPDNITLDHTFDPALRIDPNNEVPIIVDDVVYFELGSATIAPEFYPLVDLGNLLLRLNPQATITVRTYTDASGSEEDNLELSRRRAQAIMDYHLALDGNPDQLILDPRGEEGAQDGVSVEMAAEQRRAEFTLNGFLDGLFDQ